MNLCWPVEPLAQQVTCPRCLFMFAGGHSHHSCASRAICKSCLAEYSLSTSNEWGPKIGEQIQLVLAVTVERRPGIDGKLRNARDRHNEPTGVFFSTMADERVILGDRTIELVAYPVDDLPCPQCSQTQLCVSFTPGDLCPECGKGELKFSRIIY